MTDDSVVRDDDESVVTDSEMDGGDPNETEETEFVPQHVLDGGRDFRVEGNDVSGYIGVDPEYMTYSNPGEKPHLTDQERWDFTDQLSHLEGNMDDESDEEQQAESDQAPVVTEGEPEAADSDKVVSQGEGQTGQTKEGDGSSLFGGPFS